MCLCVTETEREKEVIKWVGREIRGIDWDYLLQKCALIFKN